jgi:hypothetical protein
VSNPLPYPCYRLRCVYLPTYRGVHIYPPTHPLTPRHSVPMPAPMPMPMPCHASLTAKGKKPIIPTASHHASPPLPTLKRDARMHARARLHARIEGKRVELKTETAKHGTQTRNNQKKGYQNRTRNAKHELTFGGKKKNAGEEESDCGYDLRPRGICVMHPLHRFLASVCVLCVWGGECWCALVRSTSRGRR